MNKLMVTPRLRRVSPVGYASALACQTQTGANEWLVAYGFPAVPVEGMDRAHERARRRPVRAMTTGAHTLRSSSR